MNIGGGEAADQMVRMMLTGTEVTVRLGASALKNLLAITLALAKHHKYDHLHPPIVDTIQYGGYNPHY